MGTYHALVDASLASPSVNMTTFGASGTADAVTINDKVIAIKMRVGRVHGISRCSQIELARCGIVR